MSAPDLTVQMQQLDQRLAYVEATLHRLERLLLDMQTTPAGEPSQTMTRLPGTIRFASPRLRRREQAANFVMTVTREP